MWKKTPYAILIVVLVALLGSIEVLFGCCGDQGPGESLQLHEQENGGSGTDKVPTDMKNSNTEVEVVGGMRKYLPKTKIDIFNTFLFGFVLIFGFSLFVSLISTSAKKGDIVQGAEKLEETLQNPVHYKQENIDYVQNLLCKKLNGSSEDPPLNNTAITQVPTSQGNTTQIDTIQDDTNEEPMSTVAIEIPSANVDECKRIGFEIYYKLYPAAPDSYEAYIGGFEIGTFFDTVKEYLTEAAEYNCGSGFFEKRQMSDQDSVYFSGKNQFVSDAINDVTCQKAAVATFFLVEELGQEVDVENFTYNYNDTALVYTNLREAINSAKNKNCGDGFLSFSAQDDKWRVTYNKSNPHISKALMRYTTEKTCRNVAYDVVLCVQTLDEIPKGNSNTVTFWNVYPIKNRIREAKIIVEQTDCGNGFFSMNTKTKTIDVSWNAKNPYIKEMVDKAEKNGNCMTAAMKTVRHLQWIGVYPENNKVLIPNILSDLKVMIERTRIAGSLDCGENFFEVIKNDSDIYELQYNRANPYVSRAIGSLSQADKCLLITDGVFRRLIDLGKHTTETSNSIFIDSPLELVEDIKTKINGQGRLICEDGYVAYRSHNNGITLSYNVSNRFVGRNIVSIRKEIWCPRAAFTYSSILDNKGHSMNENSASTSVSLNFKEKELVSNTINQLNGISCGRGYYSCVFGENNEAIFSWDSSNSHVRKSWTDATTSFKPLS